MNCDLPHKQQDEDQTTTRDVLNNVLWRLLQPLTQKRYPNAIGFYYNIVCADGNFRRYQLA
jgi:hypothetical protein